MSTTEPRVAIVTGGSRGIGRQAAERLGAEGYAVVVNYAGNKTEADAAVEAIRQRGGRAIAVQADVADERAIAEVFDAGEREFGGVDVVVHAAGIMVLSPVAELDLADLDRQLRTNVRGTFVVDQQAARRLRTGGAIINFSTSVVGLKLPTYGAYVATKGAVEALTTVLAKELGPKNITVNAVAPGPTATDLFLTGKSDELVAQMANANPMKRIGTPADIAEVVAFLAGPGRWVNGQVVRANGGIV